MSSRLEEYEAYKTQQENTRPPRFTEVEREAMEFLCQYNLYEKEEQSLLSRPLRLTEAIATVRKMLPASEIADKGKG